MWGHFERLERRTHTHKHTYSRTLPISSGLLCSCDRLDLLIVVCAFSVHVWKTNTKPLWQTSHCTSMYSIVSAQCFFLCMYSIGVYWTLRVQRKNWERKQNAYRTFRPQTSLHYSVYQLQRALWRKNHLSTLCLFAGWHFDTKWRPGTPAGNGERARLTPNVQIPLNPK